MVTIKHRDTKVCTNLRHGPIFSYGGNNGGNKKLTPTRTHASNSKINAFPGVISQESLCSLYLPFLLRRTSGEKMRERQKEGRTLATPVNIRRGTV
jgi:hypothetical protein